VVLAWPIVVNMLSFTMMSVADTFFVGKLGSAPQGAVGFAGTFMWSIYCFFLGTLEIVQTYVAQSTGRGDPGRAARWGSSGLHLALLFSIVPMPVGLVGERLFEWMGVDPSLVPHADVYFRLRMLSTAPFFLSRIGDTYYRGVGDTRTPMVVALAANSLNVVLDPFFISGVPGTGFAGWGVAGAAWATVIATVAQTAAYLGIARRRGARGEVVPRYRDRFSRADQRELLRIGAPSGVHWALDVMAWTLFTVSVARLDATQTAANFVGLTIIRASFMPGFGISSAAQTLVGQYLGAGDVPSARRSGRSSLIVTTAWMGGMGVLFLLFRAPLIALFNPDPEVVRVGARLLVWAALFQVGDGAQLVLAGALRGAGDTRWVMWVTLAAAWCVFVPLMLWLMHGVGMGVEGGWLAINAWVLALVIPLGLRFRGDAWTRGGVNLEPRPVPEAEIA
jgi:MATE family multidrug resistance protein